MYARANYLLECLGEVLEPRVVAEYYRLLGLRAFLGREPQQARSYFHYAWQILPDYQWPESLLPMGHPVRKYWNEAAKLPPDELEHVDVPKGMNMFVDGQQTELRPVGRPVIMQLTTRDGSFQWNGILRAGSDLPFAIHQHQKNRVARFLFKGAGGMALVSAGFWTATFVYGQRMQTFADNIQSGDEPGSDWVDFGSQEEARQAFQTSNQLFLWAQVTTGLSSGLAVGGVVVRKW